MKRNNVRRIWQPVVYLTVLLLFLVSGLPLSADAASDAKVMQWVYDDDHIKIYVRGADAAAEDATYQIGNTAVSDLTSFSIAEDADPMRTVIMLDNSESTRQESRSKVTDIMKGMIAGHAQGETFRIATFSDSTSYLSNDFSSDYRLLESAVDSITYTKQATYLTDVLYEVIGQLNADQYMGYTRIVVISDGMDNKNIHVEKSDFYALLEQTPYPIYTIGTDYGTNGDELSNMFSISANTNAESCVLEDTSTEDILSMIEADNTLTVFEASFPEEVRDGNQQNTRLTLSDGTALTFAINTPFADPSSAASTREASATETAGQTTGGGEETTKEGSGQATQAEDEDTVDTAEEEDEEEEDALHSFLNSEIFGMPMVRFLLLVIAAAAIVAIVVIVLVLAAQKRRQQQQQQKEAEELAKRNALRRAEGKALSSDRGGTMPLRKDNSQGGTVPIAPGQARPLQDRYQLTLRDVSNPARTFSCQLTGMASVGRKEGNTIVISDDKAVSSHHCQFVARNGMFYIRDTNSSNGTFLNGSPAKLPSEVDQLIRSGDKVQLGRAVYTITISQ